MVAVSISELRKHLNDYVNYVRDKDEEVMIINEKTGDFLMRMVKVDKEN